MEAARARQAEGQRVADIESGKARAERVAQSATCSNSPKTKDEPQQNAVPAKRKRRPPHGVRDLLAKEAEALPRQSSSLPR